MERFKYRKHGGVLIDTHASHMRSQHARKLNEYENLASVADRMNFFMSTDALIENTHHENDVGGGRLVLRFILYEEIIETGIGAMFVILTMLIV